MDGVISYLVFLSLYPYRGESLFGFNLLGSSVRIDCVAVIDAPFGHFRTRMMPPSLKTGTVIEQVVRRVDEIIAWGKDDHTKAVQT